MVKKNLTEMKHFIIRGRRK